MREGETRQETRIDNKMLKDFTSARCASFKNTLMDYVYDPFTRLLTASCRVCLNNALIC